jgi:hypothetical protein
MLAHHRANFMIARSGIRRFSSIDRHRSVAQQT